MHMDWRQVDAITIHDLKEGTITECMAGEKKICLLRRDGQVYAFPATCPHAGARLCEGWLDALGRIVCPLHKYRFDPANGRNTSGEGYKLKTWPVDIRESSIFVAF
jgi:3-phenylpropionate/trans-cinnamate dioxygenase ferredoxin subunit